MSDEHHTPGVDRLLKRIAVGLWRDENGRLHISIPELLQAVDMEDTPENRNIAETEARSWLAQNRPDTQIVVRK